MCYDSMPIPTRAYIDQLADLQRQYKDLRTRLSAYAESDPDFFASKSTFAYSPHKLTLNACQNCLPRKPSLRPIFGQVQGCSSLF